MHEATPAAGGPEALTASLGVSTPSVATDRKTEQLCDQVARSIESSLTCAGDARLGDLYVVAVQPAPSSRRLRVLLAPLAPCAPSADLSGALQRATGWLRGRVAEDIHRRRVPTLAFVLLTDA